MESSMHNNWQYNTVNWQYNTVTVQQSQFHAINIVPAFYWNKPFYILFRMQWNILILLSNNI